MTVNRLSAYLPLLALTLLTAVFLVWLLLVRQDDFSADLVMESDAMSIVDYYIPKRIELQPVPPEPISRLPEGKTGLLARGAGAARVARRIMRKRRGPYQPGPG